MPRITGTSRRGDFEAADQAADFFVGGGGGDGIDVAALVEGLEQAGGDLFDLAGAGGADLFGARGGRLGIARQLVEAERDGLAEVHGEILADGGDAHQPVAVAEIVVGEAEFFAAEEERDGRGGQRAQHQPRAVFQAADGVLQLAVAYAGGAHHQAAIGDGFGEAGEFLGLLQQRGGAHGGAGFAEGHIVWIDHAQAREAEVGHGAGGGADVERVARRNQYHAQIVFPVGGDASMVA